MFLVEKFMKIKGADVEQGIHVCALQVAGERNRSPVSLEEMGWMTPTAIMSRLPQTGNVTEKYINLVKSMNVFVSHGLIL